MEYVKDSATGAVLRFENLKKAKGIVIVCAGGGYAWRSPREEGPVAHAFAAQGWLPCVLEYSVRACPEDPALGVRPMQELAWAVQEAHQLFERAGRYMPVVVCGFSAGGHLAASLGVHWNDRSVFAGYDNLRRIRPDALILCYPVITTGKYAHRPSVDALAAGEDALYFSLENHVQEGMPPVFLWHTVSDELVPVQNSMLFADALLEKKVPMELHLFPAGPHGLSLATPEVDEPEKGRMADAHVAQWFPLCIQWLEKTVARGGAGKA